MRRQLAAGAAGAALIAVAILAFSLGKHPVVAGTNTAAPLLPAFPIQGGDERCQDLARVPPGATHLRVVVSSLSGPAGVLEVAISGPEAKPVTGRERIGLGGRVLRLDSTTGTLHPARICLRYLGQGQIVLAGERKRVRTPDQVVGRGLKRGVASIVFLRSGLASWASRRGEIESRYDNSQVGWFGGWTLWLAIAAAIAAALLALAWVVLRSDSEGRST